MCEFAVSSGVLLISSSGVTFKSLNKTRCKEKQLVERQVLKEPFQNVSDKRNTVYVIVDYNV